MLATSSPERADNHFVVVERVVHMAAKFTDVDAMQVFIAAPDVRRPDGRQKRENLQGALEFSRE